MTTRELLFQRLQELGAGEFAHLNGWLIEHLMGTAELLKAWGNREALYKAGLYHAVYGTDGYDESLVALAMRNEVKKLIGTEGATRQPPVWVDSDPRCRNSSSSLERNARAD